MRMADRSSVIKTAHGCDPSCMFSMMRPNVWVAPSGRLSAPAAPGLEGGPEALLDLRRGHLPGGLADDARRLLQRAEQLGAPGADLEVPPEREQLLRREHLFEVVGHPLDGLL